MTATPAPPAVSAPPAPRLRPNWTLVAGGKDPFRAWVGAVLDGVQYFANGYDQAWYADVAGAAFWPLGSLAPTSFVVGDSGSGSTFPLGMTLRYFLVFRNPDMGEETAPQATADPGGLMVAGVVHVMGATNNAVITWNAAEVPARFAKIRIYRELQNSNAATLVAEVDKATGTYTDSTPDSLLSTLVEDAYVPRYRLDFPPIAKGLAAHEGRIFLFTGIDANLYYSQQAIPGSEFLTSDFPAGNIWPIEPDDGLGEITCVVAHYDALYVFKRRGCYKIEGNSPDDGTVTRMFSDRGCIAPRGAISVFDAIFFLDERGPYSWLTTAEPVVVGVKGGVGSPYSGGHLEEPSPLRPNWRRLNLDAADQMHLVHNEALGYVEVWVALDNEPQCRRRVRVNIQKDQYDSIDDGMVSHAAGRLLDGSETPYVERLDDLGILWQQDFGDAEGVEAGATDLPVSQELGRTVTFIGSEIETDSVTGPLGAPIDKVSPAGAVVDENRIVAVDDANTIELLRWSPSVDQGGNHYYWGVIRDLWELPLLDFMTGDWKVVPRMIVEFDPQDGGTLCVDTRPDDRAYVRKRNIDLSMTVGWAIVPGFDRGYKWTARGYSRLANVPYVIRALRADWWSHRKRR